MLSLVSTGLPSSRSGERRDTLVFLSVFTTLLIVNGMALMNCRSEGLALGFERRLYRLPVSTFGLVCGRMLPALVACALMYLLTALFMRLVLGAVWPLVGPTLIAVTFLAWGLALNWSLGRRPYLLAPVALPLAALLFAWLKPRLEPRNGDVMASWRDFGVFDSGVLLLVSLAAFVVAMVGVRTDRAEPRQLRSLLVDNPPGERATASRSLTDRKAALGSSRFADFRSPLRAQLWMEWREKGRWLSLWACFAMLVSTLAGGFPDFETGPILRTSFLCAAFMIFVAPAIAGFLHGRSDLSSQSSALDRIRATRPLSDRGLALALLQAALSTTLASWLVTALGVVSALFVTRTWGDTEKVDVVLEGFRQALAHTEALDLGLGLLLLLSWCLAASGVMLAVVVSGRNWLIESFAAPYALVFLGLIVERVTDYQGWREALPYLFLAVVVVAPLVTLVCAVLCHRGGHYSWRPLIRGALLYLSLATLLALRFPLLRQAFVPGELPLERLLAFAIPAALSAAFLPFVLAPLMLAWNRHR